MVLSCPQSFSAAGGLKGGDTSVPVGVTERGPNLEEYDRVRHRGREEWKNA